MKKYGCHLNEVEMSKQVNRLKMPKEIGKTKEIVRSKKQRPKTAAVFDLGSEGYRIFGVNLMRISGISEGSKHAKCPNVKIMSDKY